VHGRGRHAGARGAYRENQCEQKRCGAGHPYPIV
jgi:hypothetical protein